MDYIDKIIEESGHIQEEMHLMIDQLKQTKKGKKIPYEDMVIVFFCMKIAELEEKIKEAGLILRN
jgi:hypothetical protein